MRGIRNLSDFERDRLHDGAAIAALAGTNRAGFRMLKMNKPKSFVNLVNTFELLKLPDPMMVTRDRCLGLLRSS